MTTPLLHGSITALITPFQDGQIDQRAYQGLIQWQLDEGTNGLVPCGTTGESPTLTEGEYERLTRMCVEGAAGRVPVLAGCGSNSTEHAVHLTQIVKKAGADAALHVVPYYNKPTQEGLYQHYKTIHDKTDLPIVIYNIPGRSVANMSVETMARLAELPRIIGVKDATNDLQRPLKMRQLCGPDFIQLSGNDDTALAFLAQGGVGCISVTSNVAPSLCSRMQAAWRAGDVALAQSLNLQLLPLVEAMFAETSPGPVKYAVSLLGKCRNELRLPMVSVSKATEEKVRAAMSGAMIDLAKAA